MWDDWTEVAEQRPEPRAPPGYLSPPSGPPSLFLPRPSPSLWANRATWGLSASSSLPEELTLLSLSSEVPEALALGRPKGGAVACWTAGTLGFLSSLLTLACTGVLWGLATGSVPRALSI